MKIDKLFEECLAKVDPKIREEVRRNMSTCRTCQHRQRWKNEFSPKVTQVCELKKGRTAMGLKKIKVTDPACDEYKEK